MDNGGLSTILLDKHHLTVGETVTLFCHGVTTSATDWIGLFHTGDVDSISNCLDYKQSGNSMGKRGLKWIIASNINFDEAENKCLFKYINGASGSVKAISKVIHIINTDLQETMSPSGTLNSSLFSGQLLEFTITGMEAQNLKRPLFGRPCPYVKVSLQPGRMQRKAWRSHHGSVGKTRSQINTTEPSWSDEVFAFKASIWDTLEIEVRNRSTGIKPTFSRFLGKLHFPLRELLTKGRNRTQTFTGPLMKREPSRKILGTFSLTIKTDRDLPGSRNSRRQASPDSIDSGDQNGELLNGTDEEHAESDGDRRPSLNASTPDDDLSVRERTSTVPISPARTIAQVYMNQSAEAQSQPDLLGTPYTTHENVLVRKRNINNSLGPQLSADSRLSMPPFVFSCTSLRSFDNAPSTSSSYANDMSLRIGDNESENTGENSETDDASLNENINRNLNDEVEALPNNVQTSSLGARDSPSEILCETGASEHQTSSEVESTHPSTAVPAAELESTCLSTEHTPSGSANSDTIINGVNSEETSEIRDVNANDVSLSNSDENNSLSSELGTSAVNDVSETVVEQDEPVANERNIDNISNVNEHQETESEETEDSTNASDVVCSPETSLSEDNSSLDQQHSVASAEIAPSSEDSSTLPLQLSSQHGALTVDLPPVGPSISLRESDVTLGEEFSRRGNDIEEAASSNILEGSEDNSANRPNTLPFNNVSALSVTGTEDPTSARTTDIEHSNEQLQLPDENNRSQNSVQRTSFSMFGADVTGESFMNLESEPDIMNVLSLSNTNTSDVVMSTQSADIGSTSPRRTMATCNLRTLFQIPDGDNTTQTIDNSVERIQQQQDDTTPSEEVSSDTNVLENSVTTPRVIGTVETNEYSDAIEQATGTSDLSASSLNAFGTADISGISSSSSTSVVENSTSSELLLSEGNELANTEVLGMPSGQYEEEQIEQERTFTNTTENELSQSTRIETSASGATLNASLISQSSTNDELRSPRTSLSSPLPSITQVRYLRSKNLSIRLPSRTSSPLPVVHVVPPNVPVSRRNSENDLFLSPIEADPILPATRIDSRARESSPVVTRSLARDVFDAPDGSREVINAGASTSHCDTSLSEPTAATPTSSTSSTSDVSNSAPQRRSSSGSGKNRKRNKPRSRSNRQPSTNEPTEGVESLEQAQSGRRIIGERANRNVVDNPSEQTNDEPSPSNHRASIYNQISDFASDEDVLDESLPPHWERAVDSYGRVYYIDHENRITTWIRPSAASASETSLNEVNHHRQNLDRRYQSFRRTLSGRRRRRSHEEAVSTNADVEIVCETSSSNDTSTGTVNTRSSTDTNTRLTADANTTSPSTRHATPSRSSEMTSSRPSGDNRQLLNSSFVKFLTRPDLIPFLRNSGPAGQYYFSHPEVKDIVKRIKEDSRNYLRFMHDRSLVTFLNGFADTSQPLPRGWEQKTDQFGQKYFVDHNSRSTNFADPRLPVDTTLSRNRSRATLETAYSDRIRRPPPPGMQRATAVNTPSSSTQRSQQQRRSERLTYNQQIVEFLRQPNIDEILASKDPSYANSVALKCSVDKIRRDGQRALRLLSDNVDLIVLLSMFEDDIVSWLPTESKEQKPAAQDKKRNMHNGHDDAGPSTRKVNKPAPYKRDFQAKVKSFHKNIIHKGLGQGPNKIQLIIRREHILEDAFDQLMKQNPISLQKSKLEVKFSGEEGLDYGGPQREFFFLLSRQLFNPYYGLFEYSAQDTYTLHISAMSSFVDNAHDWYRFSGRIIALVIIHQHLLDAFFTRPFYKLLLKGSCDLRDVEALDALFHQSLAWIMESDISDVSLDLTFTVNEELGGQVNERELVAGGKDIRVTEDNKLGYVELMSNWRIDRGVSDQRKSILKGFYEIIHYDLVSMFDACELELLISGTADIDVNDWFSHTEYRSGYHPNHKVIRWFWQAVNSFDNEQRLRLLQFVTGTSSVPYEGFAALRGSTGLRKFCIEKWGNHTMLPRAHTCFNRLDLPAYQNYNELLEKLTLAVEETSTFGIQ